MESHSITIILSALFFSAFFSGIETAFLAADRLSIELDKEQKSLKGRILVALFKRPDYFISTTLIGNTIALVVYSTLMTAVLDPYFHLYLPATIQSRVLLLILQTIVSTLSILTLAEFLPKSIFLRSPNHMLSLFAIPIAAITYLLRPCVMATTAIAKLFIVYGLGQQYRDTRPVFELTDLQTFIKHSLNISQDLPAGISANIVGKFIEFRKIRVRDCMVPRKEIVAVSVTDGIEALKEVAIQSEHAKILVYRNDIDDIIGYCHAKELFKKPERVESILIPVIVVSETSLASTVMVQLTSEGKSLALVVDEFGGTSGIISLEDIIGEILGNVREEHDITDLVAQRLDKATYFLSARCEIDDLNEKYDLALPQGDYDTLSGLITSTIGRIPKVSEVIKISPFTFTIVSIEDTHIDTVKMEIDHHTLLRELPAALDSGTK